METTSRFQGQVVLVAGGTGALGSAVARAFLQQGAEVVVTYRRAEEYEALSDMGAGIGQGLRQQGGCDPGVPTLRLAATIDAEFHRLDAFVNTAGGYSGGPKLWEIESADFERMLDLNLRSAFVTSRTVLPIFLRQGRGCIVNVVAKAAVDQPGGAGAYVFPRRLHSQWMALVGDGSERDGDSRQFCVAEHHRHCGESPRHAASEFRCLDQTGGHRPRHPVSL